MGTQYAGAGSGFGLIGFEFEEGGAGRGACHAAGAFRVEDYCGGTHGPF